MEINSNLPTKLANYNKLAALSLVRQDCYDTMDKTSDLVDTLLRMSAYDLEDWVDPDNHGSGKPINIYESDFDLLDGKQITTSDGFVYEFSKRVTNDGHLYLDALYTVSGEIQRYTLVIPNLWYPGKGDYLVSQNGLNSIPDRFTNGPGEQWRSKSINDILDDMLQSYSVCDVLSRACDCVIDGDGTSSDFMSRASGIINKLSGDALVLYNSLMANAASFNAGSVLVIAKDMYQTISDGIISGGHVDFADFDYSVKTFYSTVVSSASTIVRVFQTIAQVCEAIVNVIGTAIGSALSLVYDLANLDMVVNDKAKVPQFAQALAYGTMTACEVPDILTGMHNYGKVITVPNPFFTTYLWANESDDSSYDYLILANISGDLVVSGNPGYLDLINFAYPHDDPLTFRFADKETLANLINSQNNNVYAAKLTDADVRLRLAQSVIFMYASYQIMQGVSSEEVLTVDTYFQNNLKANVHAMMNNLVWNNPPSWADLVNKIIPSVSHWINETEYSPTKAIFDWYNFDEVNDDHSVPCIALLGEVGLNQIMIEPPEWDGAGLLVNVLAAAAITVLGVRLFKAVKVTRRKILNDRLRVIDQRRNEALTLYNNTGSIANFATFDKQNKLYNRYLSKLGGSTILGDSAIAITSKGFNANDIATTLLVRDAASDTEDAVESLKKLIK